MCRLVASVFLLAYLGALVRRAGGTFGHFGRDRDPLSGVFLLPFCLPLTLGAGALPDGRWRVGATLAAPMINLAVP